MKILIGEDDKYLANAYRVKLTKSGFETNMTTDGEEFLKALKTYTPDLILLDLVMPVKDGFTILKELKSNSKWKSIPVIVASNLGQAEDLAKAKALGADDYFIKSETSLNDIVQKINSFLRNK